MFHMSSEGHLGENSLLLRGSQSSVLLRPSTDWTRPTYIMEGNFLYSKFTDFNVNLTHNTLSDTPRIMFD